MVDQCVIADGKAISAAIRDELAKQVTALQVKPVLAIIVVGENQVTNQFVASKKRFAEAIGVTFNETRVPETISQDELLELVTLESAHAHGIVVQLPLPAHIDTPRVLNTIPKNKDVDVLSDAAIADFEHDATELEPPVQGAVREILERHQVPVAGAKAVMIGKGRLVGAPTAHYLARAGAEVFVTTKETSLQERDAKLRDADIVVSGAGVAHLVTPDLVKDGVVLVDAGTSNAGRTVVGDIAYECESKAAVFSRTPGGVGPITVAVLFKNLLRAYTHNV